MKISIRPLRTTHTFARGPLKKEVGKPVYFSISDAIHLLETGFLVNTLQRLWRKISATALNLFFVS
jgi:hypothetical protein